MPHHIYVQNGTDKMMSKVMASPQENGLDSKYYELTSTLRDPMC